MRKLAFLTLLFSCLICTSLALNCYVCTGPLCDDPYRPLSQHEAYCINGYACAVSLNIILICKLN